MKTQLKLLIIMLALLLAVQPVSAQSPVQVDPAHVSEGDLQAAATLQALKPVSLDIPNAFVEGQNLHNIGVVADNEIKQADEAAATKFADVNLPPIRVGLVRPVGVTSMSLLQGAGLRTALNENKQIWTFAIRSPGAYGIRLHFSTFNIGTGSALIYTREGENQIVRGPFTGRGPNDTEEFWTASFPGDTVYVEVNGVDKPQVEVDHILHLDRYPEGIQQNAVQDPPLTTRTSDSETPFTSLNLNQDTSNFSPVQPEVIDHIEANALLTCHLDVMCYDESQKVHPYARDATGQMNFIDGGLGYVCTGTVLIDNDDDTNMPYFLTAFHCLHDQTVVNTLEVVFFYQRDSCAGKLPDYFKLPRMNGGTLLETNPTDTGNDMSFIRLNGNLPSGVGMAGLNTGALPNPVVGIHHPNGDWKRVVFASPNMTVNACTNRPTDQYHYLAIDNGAIEGGSSGSGIFDEGGRIMGQLWGYCPGTPGLTCDNRGSHNLVYGRFDVTYPRIQRWLEIGGTINVDKNFGGNEQGTPNAPFKSISAANNFVWGDVRIKIKANNYPEAITFSRPMTILADGGTVVIGQ